MSDNYNDGKEADKQQRPLPRSNRKPYTEYTPADVSARLNEARKDLTDPKSPLAKLLSDPDDLERHLQKVERLIVSSIERAFTKVGKKFNRKRFVERVSALQSKSRPSVASVPAPVGQEVIPEKKELPVTGASKPAPAPVETSKPEEVEKVVVVNKKGNLAGVKVGDLAAAQDSAGEEEPDDTKSGGLLRRAGRDIFSAAFPTLSKLTKKRKGGEEESTKERLSKLGKDIFKTAFPTLSKVIEYVEGEKKQKSTEGVRETTRSRRALDKTESMSSALQLLTSDQRKSVDLLEELLKTVKGLRGGQQGGGRPGRLGRTLVAAGQALGAVGGAIRAAPMLAGAAAVGAVGLGAYALSNASSRTEEPTERTETAREGETEDQVYERLIQGYPALWRDDVNVQNDVRTEARLLIQQRDEQQIREQPASTGTPSPNAIREQTSRDSVELIGGAPFVPGQPLTEMQRSAVEMGLRLGNQFSEQVMQSYRMTNGAGQATPREGPALLDPILQERLTAAGVTPEIMQERQRLLTTPGTRISPNMEEFSERDPEGARDYERRLRERSRELVDEEMSRPGRRSIATSQAGQNAERRGIESQAEQRARSELFLEFADRINPTGNAATQAAGQTRLPEGATPVRSNGRVVGYMPEDGGPTVTFTDADRQTLEGAKTQLTGSGSNAPAAAVASGKTIDQGLGLEPTATKPPTPPPSSDLASPVLNRAPTSGGAKDEVATRTTDTSDMTKAAVEATPLAKDSPTPDMTSMSGMDLILRARTVTFKGDEIEFVGSAPSQVSKPGITSIPGIAPSGAAGGGAGAGTAAPAPAASDGGGGASSEGSGSQQLTTEQEGAADTGSLTFASGVDPRIKKDIAQKVQQIESAFGKKLTVTSGFRDPQRNAAAGGAKNSAHTRANAVDIRFQGNEEDTNKLIEAASAAGIGGIGVYRPGWVHLDVESKRVWGPDFSARSIPEWSKDTLQAHMTGQIQKSPAGESGGAAEAVAASPASPSMAEAPSSGGGEGGGQMEPSAESAAAPVPEPSGNEMGAAVAGASQENAVAERTPVAPTVTAVQSGSQAQPTPGAAVTETGLQSPNDPGNVEPDDAAERYAKLFNMAA